MVRTGVPVLSKRKAISVSLRWRTFSRDSFTCQYCGNQAPTVPLVIDHFLAVALGGTNDPENLITACAACNAGKSCNRTWGQWDIILAVQLTELVMRLHGCQSNEGSETLRMFRMALRDGFTFSDLEAFAHTLTPPIDLFVDLEPLYTDRQIAEIKASYFNAKPTSKRVQ
jgi:hypothetical protein